MEYHTIILYFQPPQCYAFHTTDEGLNPQQSLKTVTFNFQANCQPVISLCFPSHVALYANGRKLNLGYRKECEE